MKNANQVRWQTAADALADCAHDLVARIADRGRHPLNWDEAEARQRLFPPPRQNSCRLHRSTQGAAMKDGLGSIRTDIQGHSLLSAGGREQID